MKKGCEKIYKYNKERTEIIIYSPEIKRDEIKNILKEYQNIVLRIFREGCTM